MIAPSAAGLRRKIRAVISLVKAVIGPAEEISRGVTILKRISFREETLRAPGRGRNIFSGQTGRGEREITYFRIRRKRRSGNVKKGKGD